MIFKPNMPPKEFRKWSAHLSEIIATTPNQFVDDDIIYDFSGAAKYKGASILIVGGGISTNTIKWDENNYDHVWSMNHFFMNDRLFNMRLSLVALCPEVDLQNARLATYLNNHYPTTLFEWNTDWVTSKKHRLHKFRDTYANCGTFHTRYYDRLGYGVRMMVLAGYVGATTISFVGFDGVRAILKGKHAFEPGKTNLPAFFNKSTGSAKCQEQYDKFWNYFKGKFPDIKIKSLDKENSYHQLVI